MSAWAAWGLAALALCGLLNSVYFTLIYFRVVRPDNSMLPSFCRIGRGTCEAVVFTRYGRVFGVPNSVLGIVFYLVIVDAGLSGIMGGHYGRLGIALTASILSVVLSIYLVWALLVRLRAVCVFCMVGHALNVGIAGLLLWLRLAS